MRVLQVRIVEPLFQNINGAFIFVASDHGAYLIGNLFPQIQFFRQHGVRSTIRPFVRAEIAHIQNNHGITVCQFYPLARLDPGNLT